MKTGCFLIMVAVVLFFSKPSCSFADTSIADSPILGALLVDHYECQLGIFLESPLASQNSKFQFSPKLSGHDGHDFVLKFNNEEVTTSANAQSLVLAWRRLGKMVAVSETVIDNSLTRNYVLIVFDPTDEQSQASVSCHAVTFADVKSP
jgi:hypothetical protein